jgi:hypothetical protein
VLLAFALLAAHFYRAYEWIAFGVAVGLGPFAFIRAPWAARVLQASLVLGSIEWLRTTATLVAMRQSAGEPYLRLALILGTVAIATASCALLFRTRALRAHFGLQSPAPS